MAKTKLLTRQEGLEVLMRDRFVCQYCGLDGTANLENALMMTVDFVIPRAQGGKKTPHNLVAACRACNLLKGRHSFRNFEEAKKYVLAKREERRLEWKDHVATLHRQKATA